MAFNVKNVYKFITLPKDPLVDIINASWVSHFQKKLGNPSDLFLPKLQVNISEYGHYENDNSKNNCQWHIWQRHNHKVCLNIHDWPYWNPQFISLTLLKDYFSFIYNEFSEMWKSPYVVHKKIRPFWFQISDLKLASRRWWCKATRPVHGEIPESKGKKKEKNRWRRFTLQAKT